MEKEKTMLISKLVDDHNTTGIARWASATGFVLAQGTQQAEEQRENQIKQCSDGEQNLPTVFSFSIWVAVVPRPELQYLWYPCGSLGGFM